MEYARDQTAEKPIKLLDEFRTGQRERARQIRNDASLLVSTLSASSRLTEAVATTRLQRLLLVLTAASIAIAIIALVVVSNAG